MEVACVHLLQTGGCTIASIEVTLSDGSKAEKLFLKMSNPSMPLLRERSRCLLLQVLNICLDSGATSNFEHCARFAAQMQGEAPMVEQAAGPTRGNFEGPRSTALR